MNGLLAFGLYLLIVMLILGGRMLLDLKKEIEELKFSLMRIKETVTQVRNSVERLEKK